MRVLPIVMAVAIAGFATAAAAQSGTGPTSNQPSRTVQHHPELRGDADRGAGASKMMKQKAKKHHAKKMKKKEM